jgi:hypothetical protein
VRLQEILETCGDSDRENWHVLHIEHKSASDHDTRAVFMPDVALAIEWGETVNESFQESWTQTFPGSGRPQAAVRRFSMTEESSFRRTTCTWMARAVFCRSPNGSSRVTRWSVTR